MAFCTPEGENGTRGEAEGAISPRGCTKPMDPSHSVQQLLLYLGNIVIPLLEVLLSSSNIITTDYSLFNKQTNKKQFPRTGGCFVHSAGNRPTLGMIKVVNTGVHHFLCYPACVEPCNMRFCCASHDWFSTKQICITKKFACCILCIVHGMCGKCFVCLLF